MGFINRLNCLDSNVLYSNFSNTLYNTSTPTSSYSLYTPTFNFSFNRAGSNSYTPTYSSYQRYSSSPYTLMNSSNLNYSLNSYTPTFNLSFNRAESNTYTPTSSSYQQYSLNSYRPTYNYTNTYSSYLNSSSEQIFSQTNFGLMKASERKTDNNSAYTYNPDKDFLANFNRTSGVNINNIRPGFVKQNGVKVVKLADGREVLACRWSRFNKIQPEWNNALKCFEQAAADLGCDIVYSDISRTLAESRAGRKKKGNLVAAPGKSPHNYGVGADFVLFKNGQELAQNSALYKNVINKAIALSGGKIVSGLYWKKKGEGHHIELKGWQANYKQGKYLVG